MDWDSLSGLRLQIVIQVEPFKQALPYIFRYIGLFRRRMHKLNGSLRGVQDDTAVITSFKMFFKFLTKSRGKIPIDIGRQGSQ
jgi:hypothetical protein